MKTHQYTVQLQWTGNQGKGTQSYTAYSRDHEISTPHKVHTLLGSSDPAFRGNPAHYNPEELLVASLSACHMLWYLHLCTVAKITVESYEDAALGLMEESQEKGGFFQSVTLKPQIKIREADKLDKAYALHPEAHRLCFIANSVNFPVETEAQIQIV